MAGGTVFSRRFSAIFRPRGPLYLRRLHQGSQSPQPHLEDGSVYREKRPTKLALMQNPLPDAKVPKLMQKSERDASLTQNRRMSRVWRPTFQRLPPHHPLVLQLVCRSTQQRCLQSAEFLELLWAEAEALLEKYYALLFGIERTAKGCLVIQDCSCPSCRYFAYGRHQKWRLPALRHI
jgi:hypothetical protein